MGSPDDSPGTAAQGRPARAASRSQSQAKSCPSALCREDALLLGVVAPDGTVAYVQPPTRVGAEFVRQAQALGHPERRFRFSSTCVEAACPQWTGTGCGVIDVVIGSRPAEPPADPLADLALVLLGKLGVGDDEPELIPCHRKLLRFEPGVHLYRGGAVPA